MTGTKRSYSENLFNTTDYNINNNNNPASFDNLFNNFNNFNNAKVTKYNNVQSNYIGNPATTVASQLPWSQILDQNDYYTSCSPVSSNTSEYNDNNFGMAGSPLSTFSDGSAAGCLQLMDNNTCYELSNRLPPLRALHNNAVNFVDPTSVQQQSMMTDANNLSFINPTLCLTEPTNTLTDLSLYLS